MGLNIGIYVKAQPTGYGETGQNPQGTPQDVENQFFNFLGKRFPKGGFGGGWVSYSKGGSAWPFDGEPYWQFSVRMFQYGSLFEENGYEMENMWLAITEFVYQNFSHHNGIVLETYWSG